MKAANLIIILLLESVGQSHADKDISKKALQGRDELRIY